MPIPLAATPNPNQAKPPRKRLRLLSAQACPEPAADHSSTAAATEQQKPERVAGGGAHLHPPGPGDGISRRGFRGGQRARWLEASRARRREEVGRGLVGGSPESARPPAWGCGDLRRVGERKKEDDFAGRVFLFSFTRRVRCKTNRQVGYGSGRDRALECQGYYYRILRHWWWFSQSRSCVV